MKRRYLFSFVAAFVVCCVAFYACRKELKPQDIRAEQGNLTMAEAQRWFVKQQAQTTNDSYARKETESDKLFSGQFTPRWKQVRQWKVSGQKQVLELPILTQNNYSFGIRTTFVPSGSDTVTAKTPFHPTQNFARLVMTEDSSGEIHAAIMEIIGLDTYLTKENYDLRRISFFKTDNSFSGVVLFREFPSGKFLWGYRYVDGVRTGNVSLHLPSGVSTQERMSNDCSIPFSQTEEFCVYYEGQEICVTQTEIIYLDYDCNDGSGGGNGSKGGSPKPEPLHGSGNPGGGIPLGYPEGGNTKNLPKLLDIKYDSLERDYPCVVELIIKGLESNALYNGIVAPFSDSLKPDLIWNHKIQDWHPNGGGNTALGVTSSQGASSTIYLNDKMLDNASKLMIAATGVHESIHASAAYYIEWKFRFNDQPDSSWIISAFESLKLQDSLNTNARDHIAMMRDEIFPRMVDILKGWGGNNYTDKEYEMSLMYGLENAGKLMNQSVSQSTINKVNQLYSDLLKKYNISKSALNSFYQAQLNASASQKVPKSGC